MCATEKIMSAVLESCRASPFTHDRRPSFCGSVSSSAGTSQGPSGVHFVSVITRLGIAEQIKAKGVVPPLGTRVGTLVAEGKAEIGVQQITELLLIPGINFVAPLPKELQANIVYATATPTTAKEKTGAAALVKFIKSEAAVPSIKKLGLDPV